ncbi:NOB1 family endonuclease [Desulfurococcus amylolyticus]|uniref:Nucleotide binding protein, PINc n=1 Tax=Desulfurococcus amylolyticus DSM 16532 TaxID=768672 RepID=I3XSX5_DESAM|nr:NOB1 family endonuclease [Desulfurococcus amylolyticus]AFL67049.1 nucleotide binding protein, PINc [Desulfurococcus amylolyticus DSM 16532]
MSTSIIHVVLDTGGLLAKYYRLLPRYAFKTYTTESAVNEVIDSENRNVLTDAIETGLIEVLEPGDSFYLRAVEEARRIGEITKLSKTDLEVAALALMLNERGKVVVVTDDYSLQNLLLHLGISFKPLKTSGIKTSREYSEYCPTCGYIPAHPGEINCPICGTPLVRRKRKTS